MDQRKKIRQTWSSMVAVIVMLFTLQCAHPPDNSTEIPEKIVVLTFDDAVKSQRTFVAPLLKELGFGATFFVCYEWMNDTLNFMTWQEIAEIHTMGFEIGNHAWNHISYAQPKTAAALEGELGLVNWALESVGVPTPVSYAYDGNAFGPEAVDVLNKWGYQFARRGMQPEIPYGELQAGPTYNPEKHHPLLIPTTRDGYPEMKFEHFVAAVKKAKAHEIVVLQFHGVPDVAHPWVTTAPEDFRKYMQYLKDNDYTVLAMKDLAAYLPPAPPDDPMLKVRYGVQDTTALLWPDEVLSTRASLDFWLSNMQYHRYSMEEMKAVTGLKEGTLQEKLAAIVTPARLSEGEVAILPYPGGRHPRIQFQEGMLSPMRGTKASIFLPWNSEEYVVLDLPEAIISQYGLTFLGHKHIPTIYDYEQIEIHNSDWEILDDGGLRNEWNLPKNIIIGAEIHPAKESVDMELWLKNNTKDTLLTDLQTQVCIMFKGASQFNALTNDNKTFVPPYTSVQSKEGTQWIVTAWDRCSHAWGNKDCPCMHADPRFPDCAPGETVKVKGKIWFYEGEDVQPVFEEAQRNFTAISDSLPEI